jgi:hypothetical protein
MTRCQWVAVPGGDPIPAALNGPNASSVFPLFSNYASWPTDLPPTSTDQWNVSYQRQIGSNWMVAANYSGNFINHIWYTTQINPAIFGAGATTANTNQRASSSNRIRLKGSTTRASRK